MAMSKPKSQKRINRTAQAKTLTLLLSEGADLKAVFSELDPYSASYQSDLEHSLREAFSGNLERILSALGRYSNESAIRHLWATAVLDPLKLALLYRCMRWSKDQKIQSLADDLLRLTPNVIERDLIAQTIAFTPAPVPDLSRCDFLMPGIRIRYALASRLNAGSKTAQLVEATTAVKKATDYVKRRELHRLITHCDAIGIPIKHYTLAELLMRPQREHQLICTSDILVQRLLLTRLQKKKDLKIWLANQRSDRTRLEIKLTNIIELIQQRDFSKISDILKEIPTDTLARAVAANLLSKTKNVLNIIPHSDTKKPEKNKRLKRYWNALPIEDFEKLGQIFPKHLLSQWWAWDETAITNALANQSLSAKKITHHDRELLSATWGVVNERKILQSGLDELLNPSSKVWYEQDCSTLWDLIKEKKYRLTILSQYLKLDRKIPSVLEFLGKNQSDAALQTFKNACVEGTTLTLSARVIRWAGTKYWQEAGGWTLSTRPLNDIEHYCQQNKNAKNGEFFRAELAQFLSRPKLKTKNSEWKNGRWETTVLTGESVAAELAKKDARFLTALVVQADKSWLKSFIDILAGEPALLIAIQPILPSELKENAFRVRVLNEFDPKILHGYLVEGAQQGFTTPWNPNWIAMLRKENVRSPLGATVVVLALRRNIKYLKRLCKGVPPELVRTALNSSVNSLSGTPGRDKALMELIAAVGIDAAPSLAAAVAMCDRKASPGHRLDHGYYQWSLPKKSGGTRTISAPCPLLKKTQRALLDSLFNPLGVHHAAFGFVQGRSIKGNASIHVGQEIVANVDVKNCFPSVRWPLVLGAIRRDLGGRFSAAAIGLLVDLCTAEGGLPIGAPTSPALLNRVLHISDEILSAHAKRRGCQYSRYADDLSFSGDHGAIEMIGVATSTLQRIGLELDPKKTNIFRRGRRQVCTGLVVNVQVSVPRTVRRRLRAAIHAVETGKDPKWHGKAESMAAVSGRLAYLQMVHFEEGSKLQSRLRDAISRRIQSATDAAADDGATA
jgi:hypothetical protein